VNVFNLCNADGEDTGEGHFPAAAMINHSCLPNIEVNFVKGNAYLVAIHKIQKHSEFFHSYVPLKHKSNPQRQEMIRQGSC